jgi:hypothetical protein
VLAFGTQVCGFKPGQSRWIFQGKKILRGEVKAVLAHVVDLQHIKEPQIYRPFLSQ